MLAVSGQPATLDRMRMLLAMAVCGCAGSPRATPPPTHDTTAAPAPAAPATADEPPPAPPAAPIVSVSRPAVASQAGRSIVEVVRSHSGAMRRCYEHALEQDPALSIVPDLRFTIGSDGKVIAASAKGAPPDLAACLVAVMKRMVFSPPPDGGVIEVSYPVNQFAATK